MVENPPEEFHSLGCLYPHPMILPIKRSIALRPFVKRKVHYCLLRMITENSPSVSLKKGTWRNSQVSCRGIDSSLIIAGYCQQRSGILQPQ